MSLMKAMDVLSSGMDVQRQRMHISSSNLANAHTTRTADGGPYQKMNAVIEPVNLEDGSFEAVLQKVALTGVEADPTPFPEVHDPGHPDADPTTGMVQMPNVNVVEEMVDMITSTRAYEANVTAFESLKQMVNKAMEIGR